ncbi:MAG: hypothetical protein J2P28_02300 [Actinobacteria bacterium]|nr:hypothetical protein [Actinomycetota bacterium]MBO0834334.1 hypothetical protein [Actinomycetota bacterium]
MTAAGASVLAACTPVPGPVILPTQSSADAHATSSPTAAASVQQQVMATVLGYTAAVTEAEKSRDAARARNLLSRYLAAGQVDGMVASMRGVWAKGEIFIGVDVPHILRVTVQSDGAFAYDCDDTSSAGLEYSATGQVVPGSTGIPDMNVITWLSFVDGRWLVQFQTVVDEPCSA